MVNIYSLKNLIIINYEYNYKKAKALVPKNNRYKTQFIYNNYK